MKKWLYAILGVALVGIANAGLLSINHRNASSNIDSPDFAVGALALDGFATPEQVALVLPVTGTVATSVTATCEYRRTIDSNYSPCHSLFRIRTGFVETSPPSPTTVDDAFAWPIIDLAQGTSYDFRVTVSDGTHSDIKTLTTSTRALPAASGATTVTITAGSSAATAQTAINGAAAGAVVEFQDGTYSLASTITVTNTNGTNASPIYVRGASRTGTILSRGGTIIQLNPGVDNIVFERMTLQGSGVDSGIDANSTGVLFSAAGAIQRRVTVRDMTLTGVDRGVVGSGEIDEILVYNNTLTGNNAWTQDFYPNDGHGTPNQADGTPDVQQNAFWNDDGIGLVGRGNAAFNNTLRAFGDVFTLSVETSAENFDQPPTRGVFYYRNDVTLGGDDLLEGDYGLRNIGFYDNRAKNVATFLSLDTFYGGPLVFARNIALNITRTPFKLNGTATGHFILSNTYVQTAHVPTDISSWYQPQNGAQRSFGYQNNVSVYRGGGTDNPWIESSTLDPIDWSYNAWYPNTGLQIYGNHYNNIAAAQAISGKTPIFSSDQPFDHDVAITSAPFNETITLGATAMTELTTATTPTIAAGSNAKNAGVAIAGITDGFSGSQPDMGAVISGRATVAYGDPAAAGTPSYISNLAPFQTLSLSGAFTPTNGKETIFSVTPAEWQNGGTTPNNGLNKIFAWSGGPKMTTGTKLIVHGGGHTDVAANGVWVFDFAGTTAPTGWESPLAISAVADVRDSTDYAAGTYCVTTCPGAVHTYDGMAPLSSDYFVRYEGAKWTDGNPDRNLWQFQLSTKKWTKIGNFSNSDFLAGINFSIPDPATGKVFFMFATADTGFYFRSTLASSNQNTASSNKNYSIGGGADKIAVRGPTTSGTTVEAIVLGESGISKCTLDFVNETTPSCSTFSTSGSNTILTEQTISAIYDPTDDVYWVWGGVKNGQGWSNLYELSRSGVTTAHHFKTTGNVDTSIPSTDLNSAPSGGGSYGRFWCRFDWRVCGVVNEISGPVVIFRLPN